MTPLRRSVSYINTHNGQDFVCNNGDSLNVLNAKAEALLHDGAAESLETIIFPVANTNTVRVSIWYPNKVGMTLVVGYKYSERDIIRLQSDQPQWIHLLLDNQTNDFVIIDHQTHQRIVSGSYTANFCLLMQLS